MLMLDGKELSPFGNMYVVAEVNTSHFGKVNNAKSMIDSVAKSGCDTVKFQSWSSSTLNSKAFYAENPIARRMYDKLSLEKEELKYLSEYTQSKGISFSSTAYSPQELEFLINNCDPAFLKVASMDIVYHDFLDEFARSGLPVVLSTGMANFEEIEEAVNIFARANNPNLCILHCVSLYPAPAEKLNLLSITTLKESFPEYVIGYSDHSNDSITPVIAYSMGAVLLERHFTLDNTKIGFDNQMATEPWQFSEIINNLAHAKLSLGAKEKFLSPSELEQRDKMRRSICYKKSFQAGHVLSKEDFVMKRPGISYEPNQISMVVGRILIKDVGEEEIVTKDHFKVL